MKFNISIELTPAEARELFAAARPGAVQAEATGPAGEQVAPSPRAFADAALTLWNQVADAAAQGARKR